VKKPHMLRWLSGSLQRTKRTSPLAELRAHRL
jgi:hypothetical protein